MSYSFLWSVVSHSSVSKSIQFSLFSRTNRETDHHVMLRLINRHSVSEQIGSSGFSPPRDTHGSMETELRVQLAAIIGTLLNVDANVNENGKKAIGLDWQNNNFVQASRFFVHFFVVTARKT